MVSTPPLLPPTHSHPSRTQSSHPSGSPTLQLPRLARRECVWESLSHHFEVKP
ncbi:hypothetical protein I3843_09G172600 [Carya illinoinensis]|nr:hypothetical protein I3843_09G172600 [Carya illinoinensis]